MLRKLLAFVVCLVAAVATASAQTPPDNEIWYTTTDGRTLFYGKACWNDRDNDLVSDTYNNGHGTLQFTRGSVINWFIQERLFSREIDRLKSVILPKSVTYIGGHAFWGCSSLKSITIPDSVTHIGDDAFYGCSSLTSITIPDSVTWIGISSFAFCRSLTDVTIGNNVSSIGNCAFMYCSNLKSINIPESVTSIGHSAFNGCSSLTSVKVSNKQCYNYFKDWDIDITYYGANASDDGKCLIDNGELQRFIGKGITEYTIPESVTSIGHSAFEGCSSLTSINIPNSVTSIGSYAFKGFSSLTSITIPENVTSIGWYAFEGCSSLRSITIPNSVTYIGWRAFRSCSSLTSITIGNGITSIGEGAFSDCSSLTSITIPNSVTSIENYAFAGCSSLTGITIPDSITSIGEGAFNRCYSLTSITIGNGVTIIEEDAFQGCYSLNSVKISNKYCYDYFKEKVTNIAFYGANASADGRCLIVNGELQRFIGKGVTQYSIPEGVTSISDNAFGNSNRQTMIISSSYETYTEYKAFKNCSRLKNITIPESVTSIGDDAFYDCDNLTSITCLATTPPAIDDLSIAITTMIFVPKKAVKAYKKDPNWAQYKTQIKAIK